MAFWVCQLLKVLRVYQHPILNMVNQSLLNDGVSVCAAPSTMIQMIEATARKEYT